MIRGIFSIIGNQALVTKRVTQRLLPLSAVISRRTGRALGFCIKGRSVRRDLLLQLAGRLAKEKTTVAPVLNGCVLFKTVQESPGIADARSNESRRRNR